MKQTDTAGEQTGRNGLFENLFVLELANNHWGSVERGKEIIRQHGKVVQETGVKAAVKFQFRDVDSFVHDAFKPNEEIERSGEVVQAPGSSSRYIKKTIATKLTPAEFAELLKEVRAQGMLTMATPFDERSVGWCKDLDIDIAKIASQDAKSWVLVERIAELGKPTIISNGGTDIADLDRVVELFKEKNVPLAINHCVSLYPSEDNELELNQVDYLRDRYPGYVIGYSTHEYYDWSSSVQITYAKGARTWERHIDIEDAEGTPVSKYCSLPHQCRVWFESFNKAKEMMGADGTEARLISEKEREYVLSVSRGAYALRDLKAGDTVSKSMVGTDYEFVIPLQGNQLSSRDLDADVVVTQLIAKGEAITFEKI
ncbi:MAG: N-acetylneuraminate synthase family protein, partial [Bacteroidota bacterium]